MRTPQLYRHFIAFDALPPLKEIGRSSLRVMVFKVFDSALFTESGEWQDPTKSFRYELTYARTIAGAVLASQTTKEWEHLGFTDERQSDWVEYLEAIWPDVVKATPSLSMSTLQVLAAFISMASGWGRSRIRTLRRCLSPFGCPQKRLGQRTARDCWPIHRRGKAGFSPS